MSDDSLKPTVFHADTLPKRMPVYELNCRFRLSEIGITKDLFQLLTANDRRRVAFVQVGRAWFITRVDHRGFNTLVSMHVKHGIQGVTISSRPLTEMIRREIGYGPDESVTIPVLRNPVEVAGLDTTEYPYPLYRLMLDQMYSKKK